MRSRTILFVALVALLTLTTAAWMRSAEYDEQYTLFVTAGHARPVWPRDVFTAGRVQSLQSGHAGFASIARDLRATDVHPPLYFWIVAAWRDMVGPSLFAARLASVLCSLVTLCAVAAIARLAAIPAWLAVLLTLGCYGFVYTGTIARGFALAQMLTVCGVALLLLAERRKRASLSLSAGIFLGAATFANYLAVFVGMGALLWLLASGMRRQRHRLRFAALAWGGFAVWLPADLWFFLAQRQSRAGQFAPFDAVAGLARLGRYGVATVFGGPPLYFDGIARMAVTIALIGVLVSLITLTICQWRHVATPGMRRLIVMAAAAPPTGLVLLGLAFDNTPIELRYLAYATPFLGLLLAGVFATLTRPAHRTACGVMLTIQVAAIIGLMIRPETMQPARVTAMAAATQVRDGVVLLPRGNDGVGIVGAFSIEAPAALRMMIVDRSDSAAELRARASHFPRVVLVLLGQDSDSRATLLVMQQAFDDPCWRKEGATLHVLAFEQICEGTCPCSSQATLPGGSIRCCT